MVNLNWQPGMTIDAIEKQAILQAFRFYRGNKTATANALGIAIRTLDNKLERYALDERSQEKAEFEANEKQREFNELQKHGRVGQRLVDLNKPATPSESTEPRPELQVTGPDWERIQRDGWGPSGPPQSANGTKSEGHAPSATEGTPVMGQDGSAAQTGNGVESTTETSAEHAVPMRERAEVQSVPPVVATGSDNKSRRR